MSLDLKFQLLGVLLLFSFLKMEGQTRFAVLNQDSIDTFVNEVFFEKNERRTSIIAFRDSLGKVAVEYFVEKQTWFVTCHNGCLSPKEQHIMLSYLQLLEKYLLNYRDTSDSLLSCFDKNARTILQNHVDEFLNKSTIEQNLSIILNTNDVPFYDKNIPNLTLQLLENLNQNKTILSQRMYSDKLAIPLIIERYNKLKLWDYPTFKKFYELDFSPQPK